MPENYTVAPCPACDDQKPAKRYAPRTGKYRYDCPEHKMFDISVTRAVIAEISEPERAAIQRHIEQQRKRRRQIPDVG